MTPLRRHTLVWPSTAPTADGTATDQSSVDDWHRAGRPFVVGQNRHAVAGRVSLGLCLPRPDAHTPCRRIGSSAPAADLRRAARPPRVAEVATSAEEHGIADRDVLGLVAERASASDLDVRVFGSWMWMWSTGAGEDAYVTRSSDLDLIVSVAGADQAGLACAFLSSCDRDSDRTIDGELVIDGIGDVHWRELLAGDDPVLVKSIDGPRLVPREQLWR